ncbi:MAG: YciI family protein [Myxococcota bacterium]
MSKVGAAPCRVGEPRLTGDERNEAMEFVMLMHAPTDQTGPAAQGPDDYKEAVAAIGQFAMKLASEGKLKGGRQLRGPADGFFVEPSAQGGRVVDGPFSETKELVGGYFLLELESMAEAKEVAQRCPHLAIGRVEVRQAIPNGR